MTKYDFKSSVTCIVSDLTGSTTLSNCFYFNMTDVDKNGVITVPEFIKLATNFGGDVKEGDSDVVKVTRNPT